MASIHILKSGLYPLSSSSSNLNSRNGKRLICNGNNGYLNFRSDRRFGVAVKCKAQNTDDSDSKGEEPTESLFMKELKRRGMTPTSLLEESWSTLKDENVTYKEEDGGFSNRNAVSTDLEKSLLNQRERSISLNSEGLEGLIPRAKVLLTLGGTYFVAFWPLILVTVASFSAVYLYFGPKFVHDATTRQVYLPKYVDPYALLEDQRISETAPRLN
nr:homeobox protein like [Tanacetum cinerariifolium]